jgi:hypothetical protein
LTNNIRVQPRVRTTDIRDKIESAFRQSAEIDARRINVTAHDSKVVLSRPWSESRSPGERFVSNRPMNTELLHLRV